MLSIFLAVESGYQTEAVGHCTPFLSSVEAHAATTSHRTHSDRGKEPRFAVSTIPAVERQIPFLLDGDICQSVLEGTHRPGVLHRMEDQDGTATGLCIRRGSCHGNASVHNEATSFSRMEDGE